MALITIGLVFVPTWQAQASLFRITALAGGKEPVLIIQDRGKVLLINSGHENSSRFTVLPFLQQQGINQIDEAIGLKSSSSNEIKEWSLLLQNLKLNNLYNCGDRHYSTAVTLKSHSVKCQQLLPNQAISTDSTSMRLLDAQSSILQMQVQNRTWLILGENKIEKPNEKLPQAQVLVWSGEQLDSDLIAAVKPEVAIASSAKLDRETMAELQHNKTQVFLTGRDGAVQWTPSRQFEIAVETVEDKTSAL